MGRGACLVTAVSCLIVGGFVGAATGGVTTSLTQFVPGEVIVQFKPAITATTRRSAIAAVDGRLAGHLRVTGAVLVELPPGRSVAAAVRDFSARPGVAAAQPNFVYHAQVLPNDPRFGELWGLSTIHAPEAWDLTTGSRTVRVAVVDTGV